MEHGMKAVIIRVNTYLIQRKRLSKSGEGFSQSIRDEKLPNIIPSNSQDKVVYIISRLLIVSLNVGENIDFYYLKDLSCLNVIVRAQRL